MRIIGIIANLLLLIVVIVLLADEGWPRQAQEQLMVLIFFAAPIISIFALWQMPSGGSTENWLTLFLERKKLEEKAKLKKLRNDEKETQEAVHPPLGSSSCEAQ